MKGTRVLMQVDLHQEQILAKGWIGKVGPACVWGQGGELQRGGETWCL